MYNSNTKVNNTRIKNQFISKKQRQEKNKLNRSVQVSSINNDVESSIKKVSNEELIQSLMETMPNFGLYHGKAQEANPGAQKRVLSHLRSPPRAISPRPNPRAAVNKKDEAIVEEIE